MFLILGQHFGTLAVAQFDAIVVLVLDLPLSNDTRNTTIFRELLFDKVYTESFLLRGTHYIVRSRYLNVLILIDDIRLFVTLDVTYYACWSGYCTAL